MVQTKRAIVGMAFIILVTPYAEASSQSLRIEGSIADSLGVPLTGNRDIRIDAYDAASAGTLLWQSSVNNVSVSSGRFSLILDASTGSPSLVSRLASLGDSSGIYFEVVYDSGTANGSMDTAVSMTPRIRAKGAVFALSAEVADSLSGVTATNAELNYLYGATGNVQTQIQNKVSVNQQCNTGEYLRGFDVSGNKICVSLPGSETYTKVAASSTFVCGLVSTGSVQCWGGNTYGQLGDGSQTASYVPVDVRSASGSKLTGVSDIVTGTGWACALKTDGTIWCWGYNGYGNLGDGTTTSPRLAPVQVINVTSATKISAGSYSGCAVQSDGKIKCWGYNPYGNLGNNSATDAYTPVQVTGITTAVAVSQGGVHACAVLANGNAQCWGYNGYGGLGINSTTTYYTPKNVTSLTGVTSISASRSYGSTGFTCAVKDDGTLWCWGYNGYGQLGQNNTTDYYTRRQITGVTTAVQVSANGYHACAALSDGQGLCWGYNGYGNLGTNDTTNYYTPKNVTSTTGSGQLSSVTQITGEDGTPSAASFSCAVANGSILCWGDNASGQFGTNSTTASYYPVGTHGPD